MESNTVAVSNLAHRAVEIVQQVSDAADQVLQKTPVDSERHLYLREHFCRVMEKIHEYGIALAPKE